MPRMKSCNGLSYSSSISSSWFPMQSTHLVIQHTCNEILSFSAYLDSPDDILLQTIRLFPLWFVLNIHVAQQLIRNRNIVAGQEQAYASSTVHQSRICLLPGTSPNGSQTTFHGVQERESHVFVHPKIAVNNIVTAGSMSCNLPGPLEEETVSKHLESFLHLWTFQIIS